MTADIPLDLWLLLVLCILGLADVWCERTTGEGLIGHAIDLTERACVCYQLHRQTGRGWASAWRRAGELQRG